MKHKSEMPAPRFQRHHIILSIVAIVVADRACAELLPLVIPSRRIAR